MVINIHQKGVTFFVDGKYFTSVDKNIIASYLMKYEAIETPLPQYCLNDKKNKINTETREIQLIKYYKEKYSNYEYDIDEFGNYLFYNNGRHDKNKPVHIDERIFYSICDILPRRQEKIKIKKDRKIRGANYEKYQHVYTYLTDVLGLRIEYNKRLQVHYCVTFYEQYEDIGEMFGSEGYSAFYVDVNAEKRKTLTNIELFENTLIPTTASFREYGYTFIALCFGSLFVISRLRGKKLPQIVGGTKYANMFFNKPQETVLDFDRYFFDRDRDVKAINERINTANEYRFFDEIFVYDVNNAFPYQVISQPFISHDNCVLLPKALEYGYVGYNADENIFFYNDGEYDCHIAFKLLPTNVGVREEYYDFLKAYKKAKDEGDKYNKSYLKLILNSSLGALKYTNPYYRMFIIQKSNEYIKRFIDKDTVYINVDCIHSKKRRLDLKIGSKIGEFKEDFLTNYQEMNTVDYVASEKKCCVA